VHPTIDAWRSRWSLTVAALAGWCVISGFPALAQGPELLREAFSRECSIHVGGEQTPLIKSFTSREVSMFVGAEPTPPYAEAVSREVSMVVTTLAPPERVTQLTVTPSPTGDRATLEWCGYNELAQSDLVRYRIYVSTAPFTNVAGLATNLIVPAGTCSVTISNLTEYQDHYFAVVGEDAVSQPDPIVDYAAAYVVAPEAISREVGLFVGGEPASPYAQAISREVSMVVTTPTPPERVTQLTVNGQPDGRSRDSRMVCLPRTRPSGMSSVTASMSVPGRSRMSPDLPLT
jgi:hypothetical protein